MIDGGQPTCYAPFAPASTPSSIQRITGTTIALPSTRYRATAAAGFPGSPVIALRLPSIGSASKRVSNWPLSSSPVATNLQWLLFSIAALYIHSKYLFILLCQSHHHAHRSSDRNPYSDTGHHGRCRRAGRAIVVATERMREIADIARNHAAQALLVCPAPEEFTSDGNIDLIIGARFTESLMKTSFSGGNATCRARFFMHCGSKRSSSILTVHSMIS